MSNGPKRIKSPEDLKPSPYPWEALADAYREAGSNIVEAIRDAFGPQRVLTDGEPDLMERIRPVVVKATAEEMAVPAIVNARAREVLKARIREDVLTLCGFEDGVEVTAEGSADNDLAAERADAVMAFIDLARGHSLPRKLLPRGDRLGDWLPPGTPVVVHLGESEYPAVVEPKRDMVTVRLENSGVATNFPREVITKEGEEWTPPTPTDS